MNIYDTQTNPRNANCPTKVVKEIKLCNIKLTYFWQSDVRYRVVFTLTMFMLIYSDIYVINDRITNL